MRAINTLDLVIACFVFGVGILSAVQCLEIWRVRNGGIFTRALCGSLSCFFVWSILVFSSVLFDALHNELASEFSRNMMSLDRLVLSVPQAFILLFVWPKAKQKH